MVVRCRTKPCSVVSEPTVRCATCSEVSPSSFPRSVARWWSSSAFRAVSSGATSGFGTRTSGEVNVMGVILHCCTLVDGDQLDGQVAKAFEQSVELAQVRGLGIDPGVATTPRGDAR